MPFLFDTCILSEYMRGTQDIQTKVHWAYSQRSLLPISVITIYEIERGLPSLKTAKRDDLLSTWEMLSDLCRIYPITQEIARQAAEYWAALGSERAKSIGDADILIAATASVEGLQVVTRNASDFHQIPNLALTIW